MGLLSDYGYSLVEDGKEVGADAWVINTCTVKGPSQASMSTLIRCVNHIRHPCGYPPHSALLVLSPLRFRACADDGDPMGTEGLSPSPPSQEGQGALDPAGGRRMRAPGRQEAQGAGRRVSRRGDADRQGGGGGGGDAQGQHRAHAPGEEIAVDTVEETLKGNAVRFLAQAALTALAHPQLPLTSRAAPNLQKKALPRLDLPKVRRNRFVEIVPLSTGCMGACTYCKTKHARGELGSYSPEALLERVRAAVRDPYVREIWLSSEDTGAYG